MVLVLPGMFDFAAPPRTGVHWFVRACREAGLMLFPDPTGSNGLPVRASYYQWSESNVKRQDVYALRVSLVRHPCDWLRSLFDAFQARLYLENPGLNQLWSQFAELPKNDFEAFASGYLEMTPGRITGIFDSYKADVRLRLEDMPWALVELLESLGVEQKALDRVIALPKQNCVVRRSVWKRWLFDAVLRKESKLCEALDYY